MGEEGIRIMAVDNTKVFLLRQGGGNLEGSFSG